MDIGDIRATVGLLIDGDISGDPATVSVGLAIPGLDTRGDRRATNGLILTDWFGHR